MNDKVQSQNVFNSYLQSGRQVIVKSVATDSIRIRLMFELWNLNLVWTLAFDI